MKSLAFLFVLQVLCCLTVSANIGDLCEIDHKDGKCTILKNCPEAIQNYQRHSIKPTFCNNPKSRIVCCPTNETVRPPIPMRISARSEFLEIL